MNRPLLIRSLLLTLAGFFFILILVNGYQYLRMKSDIASGLLQQISENELRDLQSFFKNIADRLHIVRDWGKNGALDTGDHISINKKFFPFMEHQKRLNSVLMADSNGNEYRIFRNGGHLLTRTVTPAKGGSRALYRQWSSPEKSTVVKEVLLDYDPRQQPWFQNGDHEGQIYWTSLYALHEKGGKGVAASVSWRAGDPGTTHVFALTISLQQLGLLLKRDENEEDAGFLFLVNAAGNYIIAEGVDDRQDQHVLTLLSTLVHEWNSKGQPIRSAIKFTGNGRSWLGSLQPLIHDNAVFWIGVAAPEKELLAELNRSLLSLDVMDAVVAVTGSLLLLLVTWKSGAFLREQRTIDPVLHLHNLINQGEGSRIEFKSTIRTNLNTGKPGKEIELAWLKALVAFLNSGGGTLLLGVEDNGRLHGLEDDGFENSDRCLLHVKNLINQHLGAQFSGFIDIRLLETDGKEVVMIEVRQAAEPVFLLMGKNEEFYIRSGPSSVKLTPRQMLSYILQNRRLHRGARRKTH